MKLKISQPSYKRVVTIKTKMDDMEFTEVIEELVKPALIAIGYSPETVEDYFSDESE